MLELLSDSNASSADWILGVETSGVHGLIALRRGTDFCVERELDRARRRHAQTLISEVQTLLTDQNLTPRDIRRVAVSIGPGSFTGLRVGVVFAMTFAFSTGCELVPVDTLAAIAESAPADIREIMTVVDAMRAELFVGHFRRSDAGSWERIGEIRIVTVEAWLAEITAKAGAGFAVSGPGLLKVRAEIPDSVTVLPEDLWAPRATHIAAMAESLPSLRSVAEIGALEPFYLRKSAAEEKQDLSRSAPQDAPAAS